MTLENKIVDERAAVAVAGWEVRIGVTVGGGLLVPQAARAADAERVLEASVPRDEGPRPTVHGTAPGGQPVEDARDLGPVPSMIDSGLTGNGEGGAPG